VAHSTRFTGLPMRRPSQNQGKTLRLPSRGLHWNSSILAYLGKSENRLRAGISGRSMRAAPCILLTGNRLTKLVPRDPSSNELYRLWGSLCLSLDTAYSQLAVIRFNTWPRCCAGCLNTLNWTSRLPTAPFVAPNLRTTLTSGRHFNGTSRSWTVTRGKKFPTEVLAAMIHSGGSTIQGFGSLFVTASFRLSSVI
jgi:hypothetical protein